VDTPRPAAEREGEGERHRDEKKKKKVNKIYSLFWCDKNTPDFEVLHVKKSKPHICSQSCTTLLKFGFQ
jgi:hypothetical protein